MVKVAVLVVLFMLRPELMLAAVEFSSVPIHVRDQVSTPVALASRMVIVLLGVTSTPDVVAV
jgi:hypothetical protein